ncbi:unnamed protein product [marine sediment metagenome]|uniref:Uncharacterized protein n=1 Tax=marine sediment metagenome TaxID=412755 RepID=X1HTV6_9ZZZZ
MNKFKNMVYSLGIFESLLILDPIILTSSQWTRLASFAKKIYYISELEKNILQNIRNSLLLKKFIKLDKSNLDLHV